MLDLPYGWPARARTGRRVAPAAASVVIPFRKRRRSVRWVSMRTSSCVPTLPEIGGQGEPWFSGAKRNAGRMAAVARTGAGFELLREEGLVRVLVRRGRASPCSTNAHLAVDVAGIAHGVDGRGRPAALASAPSTGILDQDAEDVAAVVHHSVAIPVVDHPVLMPPTLTPLLAH